MENKNIIFIFSSLFFLIWIFINNINSKLSLLTIFLLGVFFLFFILLRKKYLYLLILSLTSFILWILFSNYNLSNIQNNNDFLSKYYNNSKYYIILEIESINKKNNNQVEYIAKLKQIDKYTNIESIKLIVKTNNFNNIEIWDLIKDKTKLYEIKDFDSVSYKKYMLSKNIYFSSYLNDYEVIWNNISKYKKIILNLRKSLLNNIIKIYPKEESIFLWWILIWARETINEELKTNFNNSWLTHFIAVSWFNITILIIFLSYILKYTPKLIKFLIISIVILLFSILVWDTAPVIRASLMWIIWYYVSISWRNWNSISIILLTLLIMILYSPLSLNYDVSLHLSFLAVLWIIYTQKFFENIFYFLPNTLEIKTAFTLSLSAISFNIVIIILNFWQVSILSPFANIAVAWTISLAMILWFLSIVVYYVYPFLWIIIWYFTWIFLKWDILMVNFFWKQEWAILKINLWIYKYHIEILYFLILIFIIIWFRKKDNN